MENSFAAVVDLDLAGLVRVISEGYQKGTLQFLETHFPSFRARLDVAEERLGRLRADLLGGSGSLTAWRGALDDLRGLWELAGELRREHEEREALGAPEEAELVGAEL